MSSERIILEPHGLILLTGSVAVGKTDLALGLSRTIDCVYFDKDTIADRYTTLRGEEYERVRGLVYGELEEKVTATVSQGQTTIVEATLGNKRERGWEMPYRQIALAYGARFVPIHVVASKLLMRTRTIERGLPRDLVRLPPNEWSRLMITNPREINTLPTDGLRLVNDGNFPSTLAKAYRFITGRVCVTL